MKICGLFLSMLLGLGQAAEPVKVIDGDSLFIGKTEIRLEGIDAPEYHQMCYDSENKAYPCGKEVYLALKKLVGTRPVRCEKVIIDKYRRQVSVCWLGKVNLNRWMVENGWAVAYTKYTDIYVPYEQQARQQRVGLWQGRFYKPWDWRKIKASKPKIKVKKPKKKNFWD